MVARSEKSGLGIRAKILLAMLLVALVPLGANWYVARTKSIGDWTRNGEGSLVLAADAIAARVDGWLETNLRAMRYTAAMPAIRSMVAARQGPILAEMKAAFPWSYLAFTIDPDGLNVGRSDDKEPKNYADRIYYQQVIRDGADVGQQTLIGRTSGQPALVLSVPILAGNDRTGVMALASNLTEITESVARSSVGRTGFAFLLDANGKALAHPKEELAGTLRDMREHPAYQALVLSGTESVIHRYEDAGRPVIAAARRISLGWILVIQQDVDEVFSAVREADRHALITLGIAVPVVALIALLVAGRLTRPIIGLTAAADAMSRGTFGESIDEVERGDEIGALARAIERMGMSIKVALHRMRTQARATSRARSG
jgi:methyl-accepting chemotaxis protein